MRGGNDMPGGSPWLRLTGRQPINVPDKPHLAGKDQVLFLRGLARAARYLEYGGGGSTVLAAQQGLSLIHI